VPLFLLMGGEFVIAFLLLRIAVWMMRGRGARDPLPPPGPGVSISQLAKPEPSSAPSAAGEPRLKRAA